MPFQLTEENKALFCEQTGIDLEPLAIVHEYFHRKVKPIIEDQYLAHIMRAYEVLVGKTITLVPIEGKLKIGRVQLSIKSKKIVISYFDGLEEHEKRIVLSHELGHVLISHIKSGSDEKDFRKLLENSSNMEPLSSLIGFVSILDKSDFYLSGVNDHKFESFEAILNMYKIYFQQSRS